MDQYALRCPAVIRLVVECAAHSYMAGRKVYLLSPPNAKYFELSQDTYSCSNYDIVSQCLSSRCPGSIGNVCKRRARFVATRAASERDANQATIGRGLGRLNYPVTVAKVGPTSVSHFNLIEKMMTLIKAHICPLYPARGTTLAPNRLALQS